ncbi:hypothetical protein DNL40_15895 [Xylanimonas oleitrophica]|uniref:Uncharacterized protein n=1 Tax=Xylanimonas oleitrophica TaxID=2607479 RepID=A0A2W5Y238_9MICO|nr:hypothetical protein [Xylanimonas oleitrophica]PZR51574.1 hypothetical protein DNL40_15895 [Xylanimonas oleitrophica]
MLRVTLRGVGVPTVVLGTGETLLVGRDPHPALADADADAQLVRTGLTLPRAAPHVSRVVGEIAVGEEVVRLRWRGATEAQLSSLFDAPGGARRVALTQGMTALLDEGENHVLLLRGRQSAPGQYTDLVLVVDVEVPQEPQADAWQPPEDLEGAPTAPAPRLERWSREWYVALALAEPWLVGSDDYPRPASNREIYERILAWRGHAWNLERSQRVDDAIRVVARTAFGPADDPFTQGAGRVQNVRFAVGRRAAETRLVTPDDLRVVEAARARGEGLNPERSTPGDLV